MCGRGQTPLGAECTDCRGRTVRQTDDHMEEEDNRREGGRGRRCNGDGGREDEGGGGECSDVVVAHARRPRARARAVGRHYCTTGTGRNSALHANQGQQRPRSNRVLRAQAAGDATGDHCRRAGWSAWRRRRLDRPARREREKTRGKGSVGVGTRVKRAKARDASSCYVQSVPRSTSIADVLVARATGKGHGQVTGCRAENMRSRCSVAVSTASAASSPAAISPPGPSHMQEPRRCSIGTVVDGYDPVATDLLYDCSCSTTTSSRRPFLHARPLSSASFVVQREPYYCDAPKDTTRA
nr:hypothetical protein CFP56_00486 [Quercus suber]